MHPILLKIGSFELASYGVMTALGYAAASWYLVRRLQAVKLDKDTFWNIIFIAFLGALIGSKLLYIILSWPLLGDTFTAKIANIFHNFRYGFVFFGGMILSVASLYAYLKKKHLPILPTADFLITALPLGHALGRIGCFLAGCCYGKPTTLPWGVVFTNPDTLVPVQLQGVPLHPTQLYETACNLLLFFYLHKAYQKKHTAGSILIRYIIGYSAIRFVIEFFRGDYRGAFILGLSPSQALAVCAVVLAAAVYALFIKETKHG